MYGSRGEEQESRQREILRWLMIRLAPKCNILDENKHHKAIDMGDKGLYNRGMETTTLEIVGMIVTGLVLAVPITFMVVLVVGLSATGMPCFGDTRKERK